MILKICGCVYRLVALHPRAALALSGGSVRTERRYRHRVPADCLVFHGNGHFHLRQQPLDEGRVGRVKISDIKFTTWYQEILSTFCLMLAARECRLREKRVGSENFKISMAIICECKVMTLKRETERESDLLNLTHVPRQPSLLSFLSF